MSGTGRTPSGDLIGTLVRKRKRGKHHVLGATFAFEPITLCGRCIDWHDWERQGDTKWAPEDGCRVCGYETTPASVQSEATR